MDIYDDAEWTAMDIDDLRAAIEHGRSIEEAAEFLCRSGTVDEVARKADELRLEPPDWQMTVHPSHTGRAVRRIKPSASS